MKPSHILCFIFISIMLTGCKTNSRTDDKSKLFAQLSDYLMNHHHYKINAATKTVFIITDAGCFPCNKKFSNFAARYATNNDVLFIITANGANLDLSLFPKSDSAIFYDSQNKKDKWLKRSSVLIINEAKVDSILIIDAKSIESQIDYVEQTTAFKPKLPVQATR